MHKPSPAIYTLFDRYIHGGMERRTFLERLTALAGSAAAAAAVLPLLECNYARAETVPANDPRLEARDVRVPHGNRTVNVYEVAPRGTSRGGVVLVIHENRGLNPHIRDVTRRMALAGFVAVGPDLLSSAGGTPDDPDRAAELFRTIRREDSVAELRTLIGVYQGHPRSNGKVAAIGFCAGGTTVNALAVADERLAAGVPYYGGQPPADQVGRIRAPLLLQYASNDPGVNAGIPAYEAALRAAGKTFESHTYPDTMHGFNNDTSAARYNRAAAELAWTRTVAFQRTHLGVPTG